MILPDGDSLHALLPGDRCRGLGLAPGEEIYVVPRKLKVFSDASVHVLVEGRA
jgi:hypothetical protein